MALDATPGGSMSNSYCTVDRATALLQGHLAIEAWYTQVAAEKQTLTARREASLITATRLIDTQVTWEGLPATTTQALACPQSGLTDHLGRPVPSTIIPLAVEQACAFWALALMERSAANAPGQSGLGAIKSTKLGDTQITYQDIEQTAQTIAAAATAMPVEVRDLLLAFGTLPGQVGGVPAMGMIPVLRT